MKIFTSVVICICFSVSAKAQAGSLIEGQVKDKDNNSAAFATVTLLNAYDSSLVKGAITDEGGNYQIENIKAGRYIIGVHFVGYAKHYSLSFDLKENEKKRMDDIIFLPSENQLNQVEIVSQKPFIERQVDKIVVNVENSIVSAGNSVFEILERSPGVTIDQNGNISLKGKQGIVVMMDGKPTLLNPEQLGNYLKGMPSSAVEKIELINNPSSKYDAAGSAGIINIKTKKGRKDGFNSSINGAYGQGRYEKISGSINFNHKKKKINWFGNYNYSKRKGFHNVTLDRVFSVNGIPNTRFMQDNYVVFPFNNHTAKLGFDFYASKKTTIGLVINGNNNKFNPHGENNTQVYNGTNELIYNFRTTNRSNDLWQNGSTNINFSHTIDTTGKEISGDADYAAYGNKTTQRFLTTYADADGNMYLPDNFIHSNVKGLLQIYSGKVDYSHPYNQTLKFETGIKSSYVTADNDVRFYNTVNGADIVDTTKTNHFIYDENINAAYINATKDFEKISVQLGLRGEQTIMHGTQVTTGTKFDRNYAQLFPSAFLTYRINKKNELAFNYSRRIDRPNYQSLNPFIFFLDPTTYKQGNPFLQPQLTNSFELSYTYDQNTTLTGYFSRTYDNITEVLIQDDVKKVTIQTGKNIGHVDYSGLSINTNLKPTKWWNCFNDINIYYGLYTGEVQGNYLNKSNLVFTINSTNSFVLPKNFSAELSFFYKTKEVYGIMEMEPIYSLNAGVKKTFANNKFTAKLNFNDILYSYRIQAYIGFYNIDESFKRKNDTRTVTISLTYNIGKGGNTPSSRRQTGAEDEKKRAVSGNG
ncbi:MAG: TonB-dependent receptor domain-containing protein [Bacteroidota bacterium]